MSFDRRSQGEDSLAGLEIEFQSMYDKTAASGNLVICYWNVMVERSKTIYYELPNLA